MYIPLVSRWDGPALFRYKVTKRDVDVGKHFEAAGKTASSQIPTDEADGHFFTFFQNETLSRYYKYFF